MAWVFLLGLLAQGAEPVSFYEGDQRAEYLAAAISAIRSMPIDRLEDTYRYVDAMERNECVSGFQRLRIDCLIEAARRNCVGRKNRKYLRSCFAFSDIVVTNKLSEGQFIDTRARYAIMRDHEDYRAEFRKELRRRHARLATAFRLSGWVQCEADDDACVAAGIDGFCFEYGDTHNLSWQHCAAAVTWFVASESRRGEMR